MQTNIIVVGIDQWMEYTEPLINSIQQHEPSVRIIVVDNGSIDPYPHGVVDLLRLPKTVCYAAAINAAMTEIADWNIIINNDVLCTGSFIEALEWMRPSAVYGNQLIVHGNLRWLGLWLFVISREAWMTVGEFDENFGVCAFEDADFSIRARKAGFDIEKSDLPFHHFWGKTRWGIPGYEGIRLKNKAYLEAKHNLKIGEQEDWRVFD